MKKLHSIMILIIIALISGISFVVGLNYLRLSAPERATITMAPSERTQILPALEIQSIGKVPILRLLVEYFYAEGNLSSTQDFDDNLLEDLNERKIMYLYVGYHTYEKQFIYYSHLIIHFEDYEGWREIRVDVIPSDYEH